jgi:hypothetical protein
MMMDDDGYRWMDMDATIMCPERELLWTKIQNSHNNTTLCKIVAQLVYNRYHH